MVRPEKLKSLECSTDNLVNLEEVREIRRLYEIASLINPKNNTEIKTALRTLNETTDRRPRDFFDYHQAHN